MKPSFNLMAVTLNVYEKKRNDLPAAVINFKGFRSPDNTRGQEDRNLTGRGEYRAEGRTPKVWSVGACAIVKRLREIKQPARVVASKSNNKTNSKL